VSTARPVLHLSKPRKTRFKECPICRDQFEVRRLAQKTCEDYRCAITLGKQMAEAKRVKEVRKERREYRAKTKTIGQLLKETQRECNRYVLQRDWALGCISCHMGPSYGGQFHAGHYRTTAAAPQLRFNTEQIRKQCAQCNTMKSGNVIEYRKRLVELIGESAVLEIEHNNGTVKWTREGLLTLRRKFTAMWKQEKAKRETL